MGRKRKQHLLKHGSGGRGWDLASDGLQSWSASTENWTMKMGF